MPSNEIASLFVKVGADVKDFEKGIGSVKSDMSALDKTTAALGKTMAAAFAVGATAIAGFTVAVGKSVKAAADMEQQVADIRSVFGSAAPAVEELNDLILDLGIDPKLKVSATQAAEAIEMLAKNGISMTAIMDGAAKSTVLLANATGDNFALSADVATDVMQQFNVTAGNMDQAINGIVGVTQASKFTIEDYALAIAQAGGVASAVGVSLDDFNAAIAATSSSFASGSDAGTSFKVFLQGLTPDTVKAKEAMKELGLITAEGGSAFFDASGKMKSMEEIAGLLQGAFGGLSDAQKNSASSTIFGTDAMRTALALAEGGTAIIAQMKQTIGNTSAEEAAATRMDTFRGSLEIAKGIIETLTISIGQKFIPILRPMVDLFSALAQTYGPMVVEWFGRIAEKLTIAAGHFDDLAKSIQRGIWLFEDGTGIIGSFLQLLGFSSERSHALGLKFLELRDNMVHAWNAIKAAIKPVTDLIGKFVQWTDVATALGVLMGGKLLIIIGAVVAALWPVIQTIALVTAAVATLRWAWENDLGGIQTFTRNWLNRLSKWFFNESGIWQGTWEDTFQFIADRVSKFFRIDIYNFIVGTWAEIRQQWRFHTTKIKDQTIAWANELVQTVTNWKDRMLQQISIWKERIVGYFKGTFGPIIKEISDWSIVTLSTLERWRDWGIRYVREWKEDILERFQVVVDWWGNHIQPFIDAGRDIVQGLWDGMKKVWNDFMIWWNHVWGKDLTKTVKVKMETSSPSKVMKQIGSWTMEGFAIGAEKMLPQVENVFRDMASIPLMAADQSAYAASMYTPETPSADGEAILMRENNDLLRALLLTLREKNMSVTVNGGGGESYGNYVTNAAGLMR